MRLIDLDKVKPMDFPSYEMDGLDVIRYLNTLPTVDAVPMVHGRWIDNVDEKGMLRNAWRSCSACGGRNWSKKPNYCPQCGSKMDLQ